MDNQSLQMLLLAILWIVTFNSCRVSHNVNAYQTFELVDFCQRFDANVQFPNEKRDDDISSPGMVIEPPSPTVELRSSDMNEASDLLRIDANYAGKTVIVDTGYDTSAVRLTVDPENIFRARLRCSILVIPKKPNGLIVTLRKLRVRPGTDWLRISINNSSFTRTFSHIRINSERDSVAYVAHHGVLIEFATKTYLPKEEKVEIELILTSFREADLCDIDEEFDCGSFRCISNHYVCDGYNNCGDSRDETNCPMDNITNYLIVSTTLLLAYRNRKQYPYLRIRTNSVPSAPQSFTSQTRNRSQSIQSEADLPPPSSETNTSNSALRRFKLAHTGSDSMPVLVPTAPPSTFGQQTNYGSLGQTFYPPSFVTYQPYTITLTSGTNRIGLRPFRQLRRQNSLLNEEVIPEHHTFPLPQPNYPILHPQLFQPPPPSTSHLTSASSQSTNNDQPPPPYTPLRLLSATLRNKKPESIAVHVACDQYITIGENDATEPIALVYLRSIGSMDFVDNRITVRTVTDYIHNNLGIEPSRIRMILQNYSTDMVAAGGELVCDRLQ
ncbi:macrophage migration inhibitory factor-like protein, partial [Euroglyphus maynei]